MHNGYINVNHEKMSKSAGNFFTVRDLAQFYPYHILRYFILQAHYRMPINFSDDLLDAAVASWQRISTSIDHLAFVAAASKDLAVSGPEEEALAKAIEVFRHDWKEAMDDDLNTADAVAALFELVRAGNTAAATGQVSADRLLEARSAILELCGILGLDPEKKDLVIPDAIMALVRERTRAKEERDFERADTLRDEILSHGYKLEDTPQGVRVIPAD
jgi:cysteinyl-tRNA synthetase